MNATCKHSDADMEARWRRSNAITETMAITNGGDDDNNVDNDNDNKGDEDDDDDNDDDGVCNSE